MKNILLASISGEQMVHQLEVVLIVGIAFLVLWWLGRYFIQVLKAPEIVMTIWSGLFILLGGLCVINFLLGLIATDYQFIKW